MKPETLGTPPAPALLPLPAELPDISHLVIEDGVPVDNIRTEKQQRLLTEPLYSSWSPGAGHQFAALANVGLFYEYKEPPLVPDAMLAIDCRIGTDLSKKENLSYFVWLRGKVPDVVIEIVSNREGGEADRKFELYAHIGVPYYVIFDPEQHLGDEVLRVFRLHKRRYKPITGDWFPEVGLGIKLWDGTYEQLTDTWLRWCDHDAEVIPTGAEQATARAQLVQQERQRTKQERQRAKDERHKAELEREKAELERQKAEQEHQRAEKERQRAERLARLLREHGIEPE